MSMTGETCGLWKERERRKEGVWESVEEGERAAYELPSVRICFKRDCLKKLHERWVK